jgi:ketosteroid isomerase-like protein
LLPTCLAKVNACFGSTAGQWQSRASACAKVEVLGDVATDIGTISARLGDAELTGKYIVIWKNGPDGWLIHRDTWNFDA